MRIDILALLSTIAVMIGADPAAAQTDYPHTRRVPLVETQFGVPVADPYRWRENDVRGDPEVKAWVDAENQATNKFLATLPARKALQQRLTELLNYER